MTAYGHDDNRRLSVRFAFERTALRVTARFGYLTQNGTGHRIRSECRTSLEAQGIGLQIHFLEVVVGEILGDIDGLGNGVVDMGLHRRLHAQMRVR